MRASHPCVRRLTTVCVVVCLGVLALAGCGSATSGGTPSQMPNIAGAYTGSFTSNGRSGTYPMRLQLSQSGQTLSGTTTEGSAVYNDAGTMSADGSFSIAKSSSSAGNVELVGSVAGPGHLSGTWNGGGNPLGTWDVHSG